MPLPPFAAQMKSVKQVTPGEGADFGAKGGCSPAKNAARTGAIDNGLTKRTRGYASKQRHRLRRNRAAPFAKTQKWGAGCYTLGCPTGGRGALPPSSCASPVLPLFSNRLRSFYDSCGCPSSVTSGTSRLKLSPHRAGDRDTHPRCGCVRSPRTSARKRDLKRATRPGFCPDAQRRA